MLALAAVGYKRGVPFRGLLDRLVRSTRGARGAIFCDYEGEAVASCIAVPPPPGCAPLGDYDVKICGAQMAAPMLALFDQERAATLGRLVELRMLCAHGTLACHALPEGYYLVLLLAPGSHTFDAGFRLRETSALVAAQM